MSITSGGDSGVDFFDIGMLGSIVNGVSVFGFGSSGDKQSGTSTSINASGPYARGHCKTRWFAVVGLSNSSMSSGSPSSPAGSKDGDAYPFRAVCGSLSPVGQSLPCLRGLRTGSGRCF